VREGRRVPECPNVLANLFAKFILDRSAGRTAHPVRRLPVS
jgi:hypothetical protein